MRTEKQNRVDQAASKALETNSGAAKSASSNKPKKARQRPQPEQDSLGKKLMKGACLALLASPAGVGARPLAPEAPALLPSARGRDLLAFNNPPCNLVGTLPGQDFYTSYNGATSVTLTGSLNRIFVNQPNSVVTISNFGPQDMLYGAVMTGATYEAGGLLNQNTVVSMPDNTSVTLENFNSQNFGWSYVAEGTFPGADPDRSCAMGGITVASPPPPPAPAKAPPAPPPPHSNKLSGGAIAGIVIGGVAGLAWLGACCGGSTSGTDDENPVTTETDDGANPATETEEAANPAPAPHVHAEAAEASDDESEFSTASELESPRATREPSVELTSLATQSPALPKLPPRIAALLTPHEVDATSEAAKIQNISKACHRAIQELEARRAEGGESYLSDPRMRGLHQDLQDTIATAGKALESGHVGLRPIAPLLAFLHVEALRLSGRLSETNETYGDLFEAKQLPEHLNGVLAMICINTGDYERVKTLADSALAANENDAHAMVALSAVAWKHGAREASRAYAQRSWDIMPTLEARQMLESLDA